MSDCVSVLKDEQYQLLVGGYVKQLSKSMVIIIPTDIISIIYAFFPKLDHWNMTLSEGLKIDINEHTIQRLPTNGRSWKNGYGLQQIKPKQYVKQLQKENSNDQYEIIKLWRIKFLALGASKFIMVGVIGQSQIENVTDYFCCCGYGYGLYGSNSQTFHRYHSHAESTWKTLKIEFDKTQIMEIILLFKNKNYTRCCLGYRTKSDMEIAFDELDINDLYHIAVGMWTNHDCVQLV